MTVSFHPSKPKSCLRSTRTIVIALFMLTACNTEAPPKMDVNTDTGADTDADTDTDTDTDSDSDSDTDADTNSDANADTEADSDSDTDSNADPDTILNVTKKISKEVYRDKTLAMLIGMCGGFLSGYEYLNVHDTPDGYWAPDAAMSIPKEPLLGLPDDWFVWMGGTCGGSVWDEHFYGSWQLPNGDINSDDDSHIDVFNQYLLNVYGPGITYQDIKERWIYHDVSDFGGGEGAIEVMRNKDLMVPQSGDRDHGNSGHWLPESYIEIETMGAPFPGMPFSAARMAERFSRVTGQGENVEWGKYWAAAHAIAYFETDARVVIEKALGVMPANSRIRQVHNICVDLHTQYPDDWRTAVDTFWHIPMSNPMSVGFDGVQMLSDSNNGTTMLSILYGDNDYGKTIRIASLAGGDGDCTASTVGGILGILNGMDNTPTPFKDRLFRNGEGRWINDVVHAFSIRNDFPLSFTFAEIAQMYVQNAENMIATFGGQIDETDYIINAEEGQIAQIGSENWGFEQGTLNGWTFEQVAGSSSAWAEQQCDDKFACSAATGRYKGTIITNSDDAEAKLYQTITGLTPGATYRIEGRIRTSGGRKARLYVDNYGGPYRYSSSRNGNSPYAYKYLEVQMGPNHTSLEVGLHAPPTTNEGKWCNIDDIVIWKVAPPMFIERFEAENASINHVDISSSPSASNGQYIGGMFNTDSWVEFDELNAPHAGEYILSVNFANAGGYAQHAVTVNDVFAGYIEYNDTGDWGVFSANETDIPVRLQSGINRVRLSWHTETIEIDYVDFFPAN